MTEAKNRIVSFDDEMLILVDPADRVVGYKDKVSCHLGDGLLHRAFSIFIFNSRKELLIQQRHQDKMLWPKIWA
ncbi:MAG: isopentenyl-diphosphate delta-isomerase, partial [Calditrichaeota bacterium]|nr:isopentenyl-diphosphate delta-isomerase [Calditrichota bacterium]